MNNCNPIDNIRDNLCDVIYIVQRHYEDITKMKVSSICHDSEKIMLLIQSYKDKEIGKEFLLLQVNGILKSAELDAEINSLIDSINEELIELISSSDYERMRVNSDFWDYYVSYC